MPPKRKEPDKAIRNELKRTKKRQKSVTSKWKVKQVICGDTLIIRDPPHHGRPEYKVLRLSNISAPKLSQPLSKQRGLRDEPFAWEAREFLREKLVGKDSCVSFDQKVSLPRSNACREYGVVYAGKTPADENVIESMVSKGLVDVCPSAIKNNAALKKLKDLENRARALRKGKHGPDSKLHVRNVKWIIKGEKQAFINSFGGRPIESIVEQVDDGSSLHVMLLPDFYYIPLTLSGIKCPETSLNNGNDPLAEKAKLFTERHILQRNVKVTIEGISEFGFLGTVLISDGLFANQNIAELLLVEGLAKCRDCNLQGSSSDADNLRAAEALAKEERLGMWEGYAPSAPVTKEEDKKFQGTVIEIIDVDTLMIRTSGEMARKVFLASVKSPQISHKAQKANACSLYDTPFKFEAMNFLRKKLIGQNVIVIGDYIEPSESGLGDGLSEKLFCTVTVHGQNVAEEMIRHGFASVARYLTNGDHRSSSYGALQAAEAKAKECGRGIFGRSKPPSDKIVDFTKISESRRWYEAKPVFLQLQKCSQLKAVVEDVISGSKMRIYIPTSECMVTFLLHGIRCARAGQSTHSNSNNSTGSEPFGDEALLFTKSFCMQKEVKIQVVTMDKHGSFSGWLWAGKINISVALVRNGLAEVSIAAKNTKYFKALTKAQAHAKKCKINIWETYTSHETEVTEKAERTCDYSKVGICGVTTNMTFYARQLGDERATADDLILKLQEHFDSNPPQLLPTIPGKGDFCAARSARGTRWYRAKVESVHGNSIKVRFIDFGNITKKTMDHLAVLPSHYKSTPAAANPYVLAFVCPPKNIRIAQEAKRRIKRLLENSTVYLNLEYEVNCKRYASLTAVGDETYDIGKELVKNGYLTVHVRKEKQFQEVMKEYLSAQKMAKKQKLNLWK